MLVELTITVKISELIRCLESNKKEHKEEYVTARAKYFQELRDVLHGLAESAADMEFRTDRYIVQLPVPKDQSAKYDKYINMLKMSEKDTIEIRTDEYDRFVEDNWDWAVSAKLLNSRYIG